MWVTQDVVFFCFRKMDCDLSSEMLRSFGEYSSLDSSLNECVLYEESENRSKNPVTAAINKLLQFQANHATSDAAVVQMARIQNEIPGSQIVIPLSKQNMERRAHQKYSFDCYVFCDKCEEATKYREKCAQCDFMTRKTRDNYFIYIPVKQQLLLMLHKNLQTILNYLEKETKSGMIGDIYDGKVFKETKLRHPDTIILPLTFNLDGASVSNSSKLSMWPILLYQNYLPPKMRFMKDNILLAGVICSTKKPDLSKFILPFIIEMNQLYNDQISLVRDAQVHRFVPLAMFCLCDLPARAQMQQMKHVSGYFACPICLQSGTAVPTSNGKSSYVRYVKTRENIEMRTHNQTIKDTHTYLTTKESVHGIKGITPLIALPCFDIIQNVSTDYMHGIFLGIVNDMLDIWLGKKCLKNIKTGFKITKTDDRVELSNRIIRQKPYSRITRKPRSLFDRSFYKAMEYRNLLWFYLHYAMYGVLSQAAINHFNLLSAATYILNQPEINKEEIYKAGEMLKRFADGFEENYGKDSITMNIHMIRHYADNVINGGPLWSQSMFGFESRMGDFKKCQRSNNYISDSIAKKYCLNDSKSFETKTNGKIITLREKWINVDVNTAKMFMNFGLLPTNGTYNISYAIRKNDDIFISTASPMTNSIDYFVRMKDETIGTIELFVKDGQNIYILLNKFEILHQKYHLNEVKLKKPIQRQLFDCNDINDKLIYLKFGSIEVVTSEPNKYEKA